MDNEKQFAVINLGELRWPPALQLPSVRFRLFVAADVDEVSTQAISDFAFSALRRGMVYFCSWGRGCERFHDIVDEAVLEDDMGERKFVGPRAGDVVMTTWHDRDSLEEALDFFARFAVPTDGLSPDSDFRLVICVNNPGWATAASRFLQTAKFFI